MAELPNALTDLLRGKTPEQMYEALRQEQCLSPVGVGQQGQVIALITETEAIARRDQERGLVGATPTYRIADALLHAGHLNDRAKALLGTTTYKPGSKPWWKFW